MPMPPAGEGAGSSASPKRSPSATVGGDTGGGGGDGGTGGGDANLSSTPASPFTIAGSTTRESAPIPGVSIADSTDDPPSSPPPLVNPVSLAPGVGVCVGPVPSISIAGPTPSPTSFRLSELAVARLNLSAVPSQSAGDAPNRLSVPTGSLFAGLGDTTVANPSPGTATRFAVPVFAALLGVDPELVLLL
jgi:hypothetical protein